MYKIVLGTHDSLCLPSTSVTRHVFPLICEAGNVRGAAARPLLVAGVGTKEKGKGAGSGFELWVGNELSILGVGGVGMGWELKLEN